jgi:hypothetical protein
MTELDRRLQNLAVGAAHQHDLSVAFVGGERPKQLNSVGPRHPEVHHDDRWMPEPRASEEGVGILRDDHVELCGLCSAPDQAADGRFVVDNEKAITKGCFVHGRARTDGGNSKVRINVASRSTTMIACHHLSA